MWGGGGGVARDTPLWEAQKWAVCLTLHEARAQSRTPTALPTAIFIYSNSEYKKLQRETGSREDLDGENMYL